MAPVLPRLLLALPLLGACAAPPDPVHPEPGRGTPTPVRPAPPPAAVTGVRLHVEPPVAAPGAEVTLVLTNGTRSEIGYNLCSSVLERLSAHAWRPVPTAGVCTRELRIAAPGAEARYTRRLPATLERGIYRYATGVESPLNAAARHRRVEGDAFELR